ncbi:MAG: tRNA (N(6)-L-threonylcarbamoyladenosine(37)-C(2))-methylthiotransferase [Candidatus Thermoplasmatota archaeon]
MRVYIERYGCTANKADESIIKGILVSNKHSMVDSINDADILIILTCTVIGTTEQRMLSRIKNLKKNKKRMVVTGCMIPLQQDLIKSIAPEALLLPSRYIHHINDLIDGKIEKLYDRNKTGLPRVYNGVIAPISISEGCCSSCSYCITRLTRGELRSFPVDEILSDVESAVKSGCKEIQLTAQDTASYGLDINTNLGYLIKMVSDLPYDFRIRVGMMNPSAVKKKMEHIISVYKSEKVYRFLHLPVQSGDDDILSAMDRGYTTNDFIKIIKTIREDYPMLTLSTDIIVGYPNEHDEQFQKTMDLLVHIKPDIVNITRYSPRPYTPAKKISKKVPTRIVKERSVKLTELSREISLENNRKYLNKKCRILITEHGKRNTRVGRTDNYKPVVVSSNVPLGSYVDVEITDIAPHYLYGKLI